MTNLTEQYRKGELNNGFYYVEINEPFKPLRVEIVENYNGLETDIDNNYIVEVLAEVPTFDEWQTAKKMIAQSIGVCDENSKLKKQIDHLQKTQARQFRDNQYLQTKYEHAKDVVNIDTARQIKQLKELLKQAYPLFNYKDVSARTEFEKEWLAKAKKVLGEE